MLMSAAVALAIVLALIAIALTVVAMSEARDSRDEVHRIAMALIEQGRTEKTMIDNVEERVRDLESWRRREAKR